MDQASLLEQLRIERPVQEAPRRAAWRWSAAVAVAVIAVGAAAYVWLPRAVPIQVAVAEPVSETAAVAPSSILDASGYVVARRQATVSAKITGKVVTVGIEEGQRVERDEVIARLDDTNAQATVAQARAELEQSKANLVAAEIAFANATPTFERNEKQFVRAVISAQTFDTAKASYDAARTGLTVAARAVEVAEARLALAERNLDDTVVRAPFAGIVTVKAAQEGEMVSPMSAGGGFTRTGIGTIVDMSSLEVEVDVSENFINRVVPQQPVTVRLNAYPGLDRSRPASSPSFRRPIVPKPRSRCASVSTSRDAADPARDGRARGVPRCRRRRRRRGHEDDAARNAPCWCRRSRCRSTATPASSSSLPTAGSSGARCGSARRARQGKSCLRVSRRVRAWLAAISASLADGSRVRVEE